MVFRAVNCFVVLCLTLFFLSSAGQAFAPFGQMMPTTVAKPCDMSSMPPDHPPCMPGDRSDSACAIGFCCLPIAATPALTIHANRVVTLTIVRYWSPPVTVQGRAVEPDIGPPIHAAI